MGTDSPPSPQTLDDLDRQLEWVRADLELYERTQQQLETGRRELARQAARVKRLSDRADRERADVDELEGTSWSRLMATVLGELEARQEKELREWLAARLRLEQAQDTQADLRGQVAALQARLDSLADPRPRYHELLAAKSRLLAERHADDAATRRLHAAERHGVLSTFQRELDEALWAGEVAKAALAGLLDALGKAQALGRLDMIGVASNLVKYHQIDEAHRHASAANRALSRFQMELADVQARHHAELTVDISTLATFADYFLDDLVSDWVVQCRIDKSKRSAGIARTRVNRTLRALADRRREILAELAIVARRAELGGDG